MIQDDSMPLCFESFQFLKEMWYKFFKEKEEELVEIYEVPFEPICNKLQQSFQVLYDPIADRLDDECNPNFSPLIDYESKNQNDNSFTIQTLQLVEISSQRIVENMQGDKDKSDFSFMACRPYTTNVQLFESVQEKCIYFTRSFCIVSRFNKGDQEFPYHLKC